MGKVFKLMRLVLVRTKKKKKIVFICISKFFIVVRYAHNIDYQRTLQPKFHAVLDLDFCLAAISFLQKVLPCVVRIGARL